MRTQMKFIDSLRIYVCGGRGGNGMPMYMGIGGKGGDVYIQATKNWTLKLINDTFSSKRFKAEGGKDSAKYRILGTPGKDLIVKCPTGISVLTDADRVLGDLNKVGDKILVARGGCGGGPGNKFIGQPGQSHSVTLDLKLLADIGFVGFPNAGKSTLLKALSRAKPKIASYPFTTICPNIGVLEYEDFRKISAADLPGLIEGAHVNYGMGHSFLKHCIRTKMLLFVVDLCGFRLSPEHVHRSAIETILLLNKELELYDEDLVSKPAILAINKIDEDEDMKMLQEFKAQLKNIKDHVQHLPEDMKPSALVKFDAVIPISAKKEINISELKTKVRTIIDIYYEKHLKQKHTAKETEKNYENVIYV